MTTFRYSVSLRVTTKTIDPDEICKTLGITPKIKHKIGEARKTPKGQSLEGVYERSYCLFDLISREGEELHEMLARIIDDLKQYMGLFHRIRESGGRVEFFVGWFSPSNSGDTFDHALLKTIGELHIDLSLDVYGDKD
jgi:hypothetical protein